MMCDRLSRKPRTAWSRCFATSCPPDLGNRKYRVVKPIMYSTAGIASYWRFEINPFAGQFPGEDLPVLFAYRLGPDGGYEQTHRVATGDTADLRTPFPVTITPASLLP